MIQHNLQADQIKALKTGDKERLEMIRFIIAQVKYKEIDKQSELTDEEVVNVLRKQAKELEESLAAFEKGNRADLAAKVKRQLAVVKEYLPAEMGDDQLKKTIEQIIAENKAVFEQDRKKIIGLCMGRLKSQADPKRIMALLQPFLA